MTTQTTTQQTKTKIFNLSWDEYELAKQRAEDILANGDAENEADAQAQAYEDLDWWDSVFEEFLNDFWEILRDISPECHFYVEGHNMGWRHLSGHAADIKADNAREYIAKTFPKTSEWRFQGSYDPDTRCLYYRIGHHDAPTGESYEVTASKPDKDN